jgi:DedD protein
MADPADLNVDELRRRARRRLVGAIVLALAAAVIVPMLLESEPKPLGESVAVKIPPVDEGKFVNRLNDTAPAKGAETTAPKAESARKSVSDAEKAVVSPQSKAPKYDTQVATSKSNAAPAPAAPAPAASAPAEATKTESKPEAKADGKAEPKADGKAEPRADVKTEPSTETKSEPKAESKSPEPPQAATPNGAPKDGFSVQLAAFSDDKGASALANRLKRSGYPAYTEPLKTTRGTLWRVRVGPYPTRDAANGVRDKLKTEGQNGIVAPSR